MIQYAACVLIELRVKNNIPHIQIAFKKSWQTNVADILYIPKCGHLCPLQKMYELYADVIPTIPFKEACRQV